MILISKVEMSASLRVNWMGCTCTTTVLTAVSERTKRLNIEIVLFSQTELGVVSNLTTDISVIQLINEALP